jgi:hypothetical protein
MIITGKPYKPFSSCFESGTYLDLDDDIRSICRLRNAIFCLEFDYILGKIAIVTIDDFLLRLVCSPEGLLVLNGRCIIVTCIFWFFFILPTAAKRANALFQASLSTGSIIVTFRSTGQHNNTQ